MAVPQATLKEAEEWAKGQLEAEEGEEDGKSDDVLVVTCHLERAGMDPS
jgi:hypothetical protein